MNYSELRKSARESLKGKWGTAVVAYLVLLFLPGLAEGLSMGDGLLSLVGTIATFMLMGPLDYSFRRMMIKANRGEKIEVGDVFYGFNEFSRTFMAGIDVYFRTFLWTLLFIIPGIVAAYSYSMTYYIMIDNPQMGSSEAIGKSKEMMRGHKAELFFLDLSFIGWMILCILTLGIGYFWLGPYMESARASFYKKLTGEYYSADAEDSVEKKVVSEGDVKPYSEDSDASVIYNLKCPNCGAKETHTASKMPCPYCSAIMSEDK